jgi:hypothetical protein
MYVAYTEFDHLRNIHVDLGMTQTPSTKLTLSGTQYWRMEYNRDPRTLVTTTRFPDARICSGIAIGNDKIKEFIYTATHCLQTPGANPPDVMPIRVSHPDLDTPKLPPTDFFKEGGNIKWVNPVNTVPQYTEEANDVAVLNTTLLLDTTNIFLFDNVEDIPEGYAMKKWGLGSWGDTTIDTDVNVKTFIERPAFASIDLDTNYPDWKTNTKKYFRLLTEEPLGGNSGGPHGVFFNRTTGDVASNEKCFAIIGTTSSGKTIVSASRMIPWLTSLGIKVNVPLPGLPLSPVLPSWPV